MSKKKPPRNLCMAWALAEKKKKKKIVKKEKDRDHSNTTTRKKITIKGNYKSVS